MKAMIPGSEFDLRKAQAAAIRAVIRWRQHRRYPGGYPVAAVGEVIHTPGAEVGGPTEDNENTRQDIEDNPKMQPLIYSSQSLNIELKNPEVDVTDDQFHKLVLYTDGRQLQKSNGQPSGGCGALEWKSACVG